MQILKCQACGSSDLVTEQGALVCSFCGRKYTREENEQILSGPEAEALAFSYIAKSGEYHQQGQTSLEIQALLNALQTKIYRISGCGLAGHTAAWAHMKKLFPAMKRLFPSTLPMA